MTTDRAKLYAIHGLLVESEIPLEARKLDRAHDLWGVAQEKGIRAEPYRIVEGATRPSPVARPPGRVLAELRFDNFAYWASENPRNSGKWTVRYAGLCEVTLDRRRRLITVHSAPGADPKVIPLVIGGSVLAHVLMAEGLLVLHASAVEIGGRALAIAGPSGAGKSTLAALLCAAGSRLVADDALRCDPTQGPPKCFPGNPVLRLRPGVAALADEIEGAELGATGDGRTSVSPPQPVQGAIELGAVVVPSFSRASERLELERLGSLEGIVEMIRYPRLIGWRDPERIRRLFELTTSVAGSVPIFRVTLPWGPPFPEALVTELLSGTAS